MNVSRLRALRLRTGPLGVGVMVALAVACASPGARAATDTPGDLAITHAVERAMQVDIRIPSHQIAATTQDGIVRLTGEASDLLTRERAARIAAQVRGVRAVVNEVSVEPVERPDAEIAQDVRDALDYDPATDVLAIDPSVRGGVVTLSGTAGSWQERRIALHAAKGVRGVREVVNDIRINISDTRTDAEIQADVEGALRMNSWVADDAISAAVRDGRVALSGSVGSLAQKQVAEGLAWVIGVRAVDAEGLVVKPWETSAARRPGPADRSDEAIREAIHDAFTLDPRLGPHLPEIHVENGTVTLAGPVASMRARRAAEGNARNTVGVRRVYNFIKVRSPQRVDDHVLEGVINAALARSPITEAYEIDVRARRGAVRLSGTVDSLLERSEADHIAQSAEGVTSLRNRIEVEPTASGSDPLGYDLAWDGEPPFSNRPGALAPARQGLNDAELAENIREEFFWSPFVDGDSIEVSSDRGIVTLSGHASDWAEYRAATENAYEAGAIYVVNNLDVPGPGR